VPPAHPDRSFDIPGAPPSWSTSAAEV
jgi:hypothetical protein